MKPKLLSLFFLILYFQSSFAQQSVLGGEIPWDRSVPLVQDSIRAKYASSDLVVLYERAEFHFQRVGNEKLNHYRRYLVNSVKGVKKLEHRQLPESFDRAYDMFIHQQGRRSEIKIPFIYDYKLNRFGARIFRDNRWTNVTFNHTTQTVRWIRASGDNAGEFIDDQVHHLILADLQPGDIVDVYYESEFTSKYGSNNFYMNSEIPKVRVEFEFSYLANKSWEETSFLFANQFGKDDISRSVSPTGEYNKHTVLYRSANLHAINYPSHAYQGRKQKYIFADFNYYRLYTGETQVHGARLVNTIENFRPNNFEWVSFVDTTNHFRKTYDKQFTSIRKFLTRFPTPGKSDSAYYCFFSSLCDTLSTYRYLTANSLFYGESHLLSVLSSDHLLKHRLVQHHQWKLYRDMLNESKIFYYLVNVQDRRLGEHYMDANINYAYQYNLIAVPYKKSFLYFMPRYGGLKYHLGELPYYLEGSIASLEPRNFQEIDSASQTKRRFIRTHKGTFEENSRVENARVKILLDSNTVRVHTKENLSGQFSTVLRPLYLKDYIDSSISSHYFKRCIDKPGAKDKSVRLSSKSNVYPFRYNFNCSHTLAQNSQTEIGLKDWFSFPISKQSIPELPSHDYYFDFGFTDVYNFALEFDRKTIISNAADLSQLIQNDYFSLESSVKQMSESTWLLNVQLSVKKPSIPLTDMQKLEELLTALEKINNLQLRLAYNG